MKGGSRLTGIIPIADLTHHTESLTFLAIDKKCDTDDRFFNLLLRCQDRLSEMQEQLASQSLIFTFCLWRFSNRNSAILQSAYSNSNSSG
ncbi:MAG: hypothetical protein Q9N32_00640 [Gammaproteobacteria bacterium]|nr:hypothetical protein [Gammaproteobacteria bacterium]